MYLEALNEAYDLVISRLKQRVRLFSYTRSKLVQRTRVGEARAYRRRLSTVFVNQLEGADIEVELHIL